MDLFDYMKETTMEKESPLASRMRPTTLDEVVGQEHIIGPGKLLYRAIKADKLGSVIFYGPPGTGKTTLARVIANTTSAEFTQLNATTAGKKDMEEVVKEAQQRIGMYGKKTILFVDEIHRFNKGQQDYLLPFVEDGTLVLIGATTENPSFEVNGALLSRCKVFVLQGLKTEDLVALLSRALTDPRGFGGQNIRMEDDALTMIASFANGDARMALSTLEMAVLNGDLVQEKKRENGQEVVQEVTVVTPETLEQCTSKKTLLYDKKGEEHYNLISALHKSMRNSDPDAAVYWLARMLEAGEDPLYVARRVVRFASEDIGLADPRALEIAVAAYQACHFIGMPECSVNLTQAVTYMAMVPKSNAMEVAYFAAREDAIAQLAEPVPLVLRNAPTKLMKELDYGKGYQYAHDTKEKMTAMQCLPDSLVDREYYRPTEQGLEARFKERLAQIKDWKRKHRENL